MAAESEPEEYLAILKASYDYEPQSEEEIAIKEDQILFLLERTDDEWWKVKVKGESQDAESPVGLVPAAYVEQANHTSVVKALYDYTAAAPGEISVKEDDILLTFDQEEDWLLVQNKADGGKAGFIPATYVEPYDEEDETKPASTSEIVIPPSPTRPTSAYADPADLVKASKAKADDIQTWHISEVDKKGKKKKGTLGIGNGSVFFASESDKTPVQKWQTAEISNMSIEKSKHVYIDVGGSSPIQLHFNAGSKDVADAIVAKLESSREFAGGPPASPIASSSTRRLPPLRAISPKSGKLQKKPGASVHFSPASPVVIPPRESSEDEEHEEHEPEVNGYEPAEDSQAAIALYDFDADGDDELSVKAGEELVILERDGDEWWKCRNAHGGEGVVPASYLEAPDTNRDKLASAMADEPVDAVDDNDRGGDDEDAALAKREAQERETAERLEKEQARKELKRLEAEQRAKATAAAAEAEAKRRKEQKATTRAEPPKTERNPRKPASETPEPKSKSSEKDAPSRSRTSTDPKQTPPPERTRTWHDRTGQFRVEAAFLGYANGKLRLHKVNGVIVEVPADKMSVEDIRYVEKMTSKRPGSAKTPSDDDIPLAALKPDTTRDKPPRSVTPKKGPSIDWFEFFLSAGCQLDDCTRYASSFERDKIDAALLPDITDATMRSLGLLEGDIIRVGKLIQQRKLKPTNGSDVRKEQLLRDEELARQLQAEEDAGAGPRAPAPNLFAGPQGVLKTTRRGRPQPSKSLPPATVDLDAISPTAGQSSGSPRIVSPAQPPPKSSPALAVPSGFDDDAWSNRPSSTKPTPSAPAVPAERAPSAPPTSVAPVTPAPAASPPRTGSSLAKTTGSDVFSQLARLSELRTRNPATISPSPSLPAPTSRIISPAAQLGARPEPQPQPAGFLPPANAPRGPFAPVPTNQALLQPLIPINSNLGGFIPTRPTSNLTPPMQSQPAFVSAQPTGFLSQQPPGFIGAQMTGFPGPQMMMSQPTGMPMMGNFDSGNTFAQPSFSSGFAQSPFNNPVQAPPVPPLPPSVSDSTSPANIFAQMKSGTFASGNENATPQPSAKYDALRPSLAPQPTGWVYQNGIHQGGYSGY